MVIRFLTSQTPYCKHVQHSLFTPLLLSMPSNISYTFVAYKIVGHPDVAGASPVGAAPTTSVFSTWHMASMDWAKTTARWDEKHFSFGIYGAHIRGLMVCCGTTWLKIGDKPLLEPIPVISENCNLAVVTPTSLFLLGVLWAVQMTEPSASLDE